MHMMQNFMKGVLMDNGIVIQAITTVNIVLVLVVIVTFLKIAKALSELTDKLSSLITIAYEAEHDPNIAVCLSCSKKEKDGANNK